MARRQADKEWVEGFASADGKVQSLGTMTKLEDLQRLQIEKKEQLVNVNKELVATHNEVLQLQKALDAACEEYTDLSDRTDASGMGYVVNIDQDQMASIDRLVPDAMKQFLEAKELSENDYLEVDVQFLPYLDNQPCRQPLDATFSVRLNQQVLVLQQQAAKYWGLNEEKVFFLDRDHRIIPDNMLLKYVILPPGTSQSKGDADSEFDAGDGSSALLAREGSAIVPLGAQPQKPLKFSAVKGKNYCLLLVKAGTNLMTEDLNKPKGEGWSDFTFNADALLQQLTAARRDDLAQGDEPMLNEIPRLDDIMDEAKEEKRRKRWDTRCRFAEIVLFSMSICLYYGLLSQWDPRMLAMNQVTEGVRDHITLFNIREQADYGVADFRNVSGRTAYEGWLNGPLKRTLVDRSILGRENIYIVAARGYKYVAPPNDLDDSELAFCSEPAFFDPNATGTTTTITTTTTTTSTSTSTTSTVSDTTIAAANVSEFPAGPTCIYNAGLRNCLNQRVVRVLQIGIDQNHQVPVCKPRFTWTSARILTMGLSPDDPWSRIHGSVNVYYDGEGTNLVLDNATAYMESLQYVQFDDSVPAIMFLIFVYVPSLNYIVVFYFLIEDSLSGSLSTRLQHDVINMHMSNAGTRSFIYILVLMCTIGCFLMELRRITGFPKRFASLDDLGEMHERVRGSTFVFLLMPIGVFIDFVLFVWRATNTTDDLLTLDTSNFLTEEAMQAVHGLMGRDGFQAWLTLVLIFLFNFLFFRYCLMFFRQMAAVHDMVLRVLKPLAMNLMYIVMVALTIFVMFYLLYSAREENFRGPAQTAMVVIRFMDTGISDWQHLYEYWPTLWLITLAGTFVLITLFFHNLTLAVMLSHKKELDLYRNANFHEFWNKVTSKKKDKTAPNKRNLDFNPAKAGEDFTEVVQDEM